MNGGAFTQAVRELIATDNAAQLSREFAQRLASAWPRKAIGFALGADGSVVSPSAADARTRP
jgi:hypothetical protein